MSSPTVGVAVACGTAGAYVDVSNWLESEEDFSYREGRETGFDDVLAGEFSFVLRNGLGLFTPGNTPTVFTGTVFAAGVSAGATAISVSASIPAGSFVVLGSGATSEVVVTSAVSGAGPFSVSLAAETSLVFAHAGGEGAVPMVSLSEGMGVSWALNSRLVSGSIQGFDPSFPSANPGWGLVRVTCTDMLGNAARNTLGLLASSIVYAASPYLYWPLNDAVGATFAAETSGNFGPPLTAQEVNGWPVFGAPGVPEVGETQIEFPNAGFLQSSAPFPTIDYADGEMGWWSGWFTTSDDGGDGNVGISTDLGLILIGQDGLSHKTWAAYGPGGSSVYFPLSFGVPTYLSVHVWNYGTSCHIDLYVNGTLVSSDYASVTLPTNATKQPKTVTVGCTGITFNVSHLSHTPSQVNESLVSSLTEAGRLTAIGAVSTDITLDTLPTDLSTAPIGYPATDGQSALDALNDIIRTEQGYIYTSTSGTLTAPVQTIKVRARNRPTTITYSFDIGTEGIDDPGYIRDITNLVGTTTVEGGNSTSLIVKSTDTTVTVRAGSKNDTLTTLTTSTSDLYEAGTDRLYRGANVQLRPQSFTVDARLTPTDRLTDLTSLIPGDRVRLTSNPSTQLGFSTWDGWYVGRTETHTTGQNLFTLYFEPCTPRTAIFDTDGFMADGALTLSADINSTVTTMSVASSDTTTPVLLALTGTPYVLQIDSEQVTVTAVTSATPQVVTMTRGVNGTTAAAHTAGALVDLATSALFAY